MAEAAVLMRCVPVFHEIFGLTSSPKVRISKKGSKTKFAKKFKSAPCALVLPLPSKVLALRHFGRCKYSSASSPGQFEENLPGNALRGCPAAAARSVR